MEALQRLHNRGSVSTGPYQIGNSLKFEEDNSESLWKTFSSEGTGTGKTFTISGWVKRTELGGIDIFMGVGRAIGSDANDGAIRFNSDQFQFVNFASNAYNVRTNAVFRDTSAWYHIMVAVDTTQGTDSNRVKLYVNGELQTSLTGTAYPTQNYQFKWGRAEEHVIGARPDSDATAGVAQVSQFWSGYMSDVYFIDGLQLAPTDFGEYDEDSGIWKPIKASPTFGTNGFKLEFKSSGSLGSDTSGNGHTFTLNNITSADQATDTPTNNFCTLNPIFQSYGSYDELTISEGATRAVNAASAYKSATSTIGVSTGKWYWEVNVTDRNTITTIGVTMPFYWNAGNAPFGGTVYYGQTGQRHNNSVAGGGQDSFGNGYTDGDIISFALDMDATTPTLAVRKNNSLVTGNNATGNLMYGLSLTGSGGTFLPPKEDFYFAKLVGYGANTFDINFGGYTTASISSAASDGNGYGTFEYAPPSGYYAICTKNLEEYG